MNCKHCDSHLGENYNYCPDCGQEIIEVITWKNLWSRLLEGMAFDKGFSYNIKSLFIEGGHAANRFIQGQTKVFQNPILFFFTAIGIFFLVINLTDGLLSGEFKDFQADGSVLKLKTEISGPDQNAIRWIYLLAITLIVPMASLILYVFKKRPRVQFLNSLIAGILLLSELTLFNAVIMVVNRVTFKLLTPHVGFYNISFPAYLAAAVILLPYTWFFTWTYYGKNKNGAVRALLVILTMLALTALLGYLSSTTISTVRTSTE